MNRHARRASAAKANKTPKGQNYTEEQAVKAMQVVMAQSGALGNFQSMVESFEGFAQELSSKVEQLLEENARLLAESQARHEIMLHFIAEITGHDKGYLADTWALMQNKYGQEKGDAT